MRIPRTPPAQVTQQTIVTQKDTTREKDDQPIIKDEFRVSEVPSTTRSVPPGYEVGDAFCTHDLKLSRKWQSAGITIGVRLPYPMRPGNEEDAKAGMEMARSLAENAAVESVDSVSQFLDQLIEVSGR